MLLTTHYMFEADALCDRIAVIANGEIVAQGTPRPAEGRRRRRQRRRGRGLRRRGGLGRARARTRRRPHRDARGSRAEAAPDRADGPGPGADARDPLAAERRLDRPRLLARADARGRVRRSSSPLREDAPPARAGLAPPDEDALALDLQHAPRRDLPALLRDRRVLHVPGGRRSEAAPVRVARRGCDGHLEHDEHGGRRLARAASAGTARSSCSSPHRRTSRSSCCRPRSRWRRSGSTAWRRRCSGAGSSSGSS